MLDSIKSSVGDREKIWDCVPLIALPPTEKLSRWDITKPSARIQLPVKHNQAIENFTVEKQNNTWKILMDENAAEHTSLAIFPTGIPMK